MKVGDRARFISGRPSTPGEVTVIELRVHDGLGPEAHVVTAVIEDSNGTVREVSAEVLKKI